MKTRLFNALTAVFLFLIPSVIFAQAPPLGTAANYVIYTTIGAVGNTGISHITGNVGTNNGAVTGFGNVNGVMSISGDPNSAQAATDLLIAYNQLNSTIPAYFPAPLLGNGDTLVAGVYSIAGAATLNGNLILNAQGDTNAVFIFKIQGTYSTAANSNIILINGIKACNVFWKVEGLVSMAAGTTMRGTVIANNAAINILTGSTLEGRALSTAGQVTVSGVLAYIPAGCGSPYLTGPVAPVLSSVACFTVFSSNGPVTNVGITNVAGDVGSNNGLTTGFNPLFVTGAIHPIADGTTAAAASNLLNAYTYLNTLPYDIELLYPAQFGNQLVLTPHTYVMNGAVTFTDTIILNAEGNVDAVFIIKVYGAINTSTYSNVKLINGTKKENVYWMVNGSVSINDYSEFIGTIISTGAMNLNTGVKLDGRALTTVGAINTSAITVNAVLPPGCLLASGPVITTEPANITACVGDSVMFTVSATGTGLAYQWRKGTVNLINGGSISGATSDTLRIIPTILSDTASNYNVIVSGSALPNDTSINVSLILNTTPVITTEPLNITACVGDSVMFSVSATGTGLTYQWRKGSLILSNSVNISGVNSDTLKINPVNIVDAVANYNVIVSGCGNDTSINVSLIMDTAPIITTEPSNITACVGDSIMFSVSASGSGLTYQWRKGAIILSNSANISGVNSDTLKINPVNFVDAEANYNVIVSGCGNDTSINAALVVNTAPVITIQPVNQTICALDSVSLSVVATGSGLTYQWRKGTVNLVNGGNISGANSDTLKINPMLIADTASNYNVIISGSCSPNDTSVNVSIIKVSAPIITTEPVSQSVCSGSPAKFWVAATGSNLSYQWMKGSIVLSNGINISGVNSDTLTINPVNIADSAVNYYVIVSGGCSINDTSINVSLAVNIVPVIITQPVNKTVCSGESVSFTVVASGSAITYQWRKGSVNLINGGNISGATSATLTINPATILDTASNYNVVVSGGCVVLGSTSAAVNLKSAGNFGILAGTAISSTGFSVINGMDVGLSPGFRSSITGFPPASVVNGAIYASDDIAPPGVPAMLIQAKQDLTDAYLFAEGATAPAPATVAGDQGGTTLAPGIYKSTSTLLIQSGDLTLDAQGNANATWIFQIASDFTTIGGAGGNVILTGGALAKNVFWQVGSSATIGNGTSFKGTIMALTSITMNTGSSIDGRLLARNGAVVLSGTNIINNPADTASIPTNLTSMNVSLAVNPPTVITTEPLNQTACAGSSVSFSVTATGSNLTYQWRKGTINLTNGVNISGANSATLTINPVGIIDAANNYNVIVSGSCTPNDTSINVSLVVNSNTLITAEPINQTICAGSSVSFTVTATGSALTYQWRKGTVNLINGGSISGATSAMLTINPVNIIDAAANYNVIITGVCGNDTSVNVSLVVNTATVIITEPVNITACAGSSVSFSVTATGSNLTYQWRKGTINLTNGVNISGANSATLTINPVGIIDAANNYNVIVSGSCTPNDTSINVSLVVNSNTLITAEPINQTICDGSSVSFTVTATGSALTYQWRKGTVNLINGGRISGATSAMLTINPVNVIDAAANYNVIITGVCANDTSVNVSLVVNTAPVIITEPINITSCVGSSVSFSVTATGSNLTYQWRKGTVNLVNGGTISGATSAILIINPVSFIDAAANYNVIVTGGCLPNDTSNNVSLVVNAITLITSEPVSQTVCEGSSVSFSVTATGTALTYQWRKGNVNLINGASVSGVTSSVLTINPANTIDNANNYNVIVTGACAKDTSVNVSLVVNTVPVIITEPINIIACAGSSVSFTVVATGTAITYQWRKGSVNLTNGGNISGVNTAVLTINPVSSADTATNYNVLISGSCVPTANSLFVSLSVNPLPVATINSNSPVCLNSSVILSAHAVTAGTYLWTGPNGFTSTDQNPVILAATMSNAGTYSFTVSAYGCSSNASLTVVVNDCQADLSVVKTVNNVHPNIGYDVVFTIVATNNGTYDATGVTVNDILQNGYTYISSTTTTGIYDPITGDWSIGNMNNGASETLTVTATVNTTGSYVNTATISGIETDPDMTNNVSTIETDPTEFHIPEGFSPNGDGINDLFVIRGIDNYPNNTFMIFNRWGNKVFESSPYQNTWDGSSTDGVTVGGSALPTGTYFYILDLKDGSDVYKGSIYLNR